MRANICRSQESSGTGIGASVLNFGSPLAPGGHRPSVYTTFPSLPVHLLNCPKAGPARDVRATNASKYAKDIEISFFLA